MKYISLTMSLAALLIALAAYRAIPEPEKYSVYQAGNNTVVVRNADRHIVANLVDE